MGRQTKARDSWWPRCCQSTIRTLATEHRRSHQGIPIGQSGLSTRVLINEPMLAKTLIGQRFIYSHRRVELLSTKCNQQNLTPSAADTIVRVQHQEATMLR